MVVRSESVGMGVDDMKQPGLVYEGENDFAHPSKAFSFGIDCELHRIKVNDF